MFRLGWLLIGSPSCPPMTSQRVVKGEGLGVLGEKAKTLAGVDVPGGSQGGNFLQAPIPIFLRDMYGKHEAKQILTFPMVEDVVGWGSCVCLMVGGFRLCSCCLRFRERRRRWLQWSGDRLGRLRSSNCRE